MFISMVLEKMSHYLVSEQKRLFWSINSAGTQARLLILKNASQINRFTYLIYGISVAWSIVLLPVLAVTENGSWLRTFLSDISGQVQIFYTIWHFILHLS
jgi:hypothetical protein